MKKRTKVWLIAATALILVGSMLFVGVMSKMNWDLSSAKYETNTHTVTDIFTNLSVTTKNADVIFAVSKDDSVSVVCYEDVHVKHRVSVEGDTLMIDAVDTRKWYQHLYIFTDSPTVTVYLPEGTYGDLAVKATTGDVQIPQGYSFASADIKVTTGDITCSSNVAGDMMLKVTTGDVNLSNITCRKLTATGTTGDVTLRNVVATGSFSIESTTGDVSFAACDAAELTVKTTTGDITGTLLTAKVFDAHVTTGDVKVPGTTTGGKCKLKATTGDIKITIQ